jgi:hypothetical protein
MKRTIKVFLGDASTEHAGDANADGAEISGMNGELLARAGC